MVDRTDTSTGTINISTDTIKKFLRSVRYIFYLYTIYVYKRSHFCSNHPVTSHIPHPASQKNCWDALRCAVDASKNETLFSSDGVIKVNYVKRKGTRDNFIRTIRLGSRFYGLLTEILVLTLLSDISDHFIDSLQLSQVVTSPLDNY